MTTVNIQVDQEVPVTYKPLGANGEDAVLDGPLKTEVLEGDAQGIVEADGLTVSVVPGTTVGTARIRVFGDGQIGPGERTVEDIIEATFTSAGATSMVGSVGVAIPKRSA